MAACPALFVEIHRPDVIDRDEARALASSIETWQRRSDPDATISAGLGAGRMVPYLHNAMQLQHPPGVIWTHLIAFAPLDPADRHQPEQFILRGRLASAVFALVTVAAVFWAGHSIGGVVTAALAALICIANPVFIYHARLATASTQHAALTLLSISAALWAIRPLRPAPFIERQFIGWVSCGLALGAAVYSGGPWTLLYVSAPVLLMLVLCPGRMGHLMGLAAALLIGVLMVMPWAVYADGHDPHAYERWLASMAPVDWSDWPSLADRIWRRGGMLLAAMLPWTLWIMGAVVQPFSTSSAGSRQRMLLGWVWFIGALVLVVLDPAEVRLADLLIVLPASAILLGQLFNQYTDLAAEGRYARFWCVLRWPHMALLIAASIGLPAMLYFQAALVERGWLGAELTPPPWYFGGALALALLAIVLLTLRWVVRHYPARALSGWVAWTIAILVITAFPLTRGRTMVSIVRQDASTLAAFSEGQPVFMLQRQQSGDQPDPSLSLYARRVIPIIDDEQLRHLIDEHDHFVLMVPRTAEPPPPQLGLITTLASVDAELWQYPAQRTTDGQ